MLRDLMKNQQWKRQKSPKLRWIAQRIEVYPAKSRQNAGERLSLNMEQSPGIPFQCIAISPPRSIYVAPIRPRKCISRAQKQNASRVASLFVIVVINSCLHLSRRSSQNRIGCHETRLVMSILAGIRFFFCGRSRA